MTTEPFLPPDEQRFYDSTVDGLRRAGWSRFDAEGEACERIEALRARKREAMDRIAALRARKREQVAK